MRNFFAARAGRRPQVAGERRYLALRDGSGDRLAALLTYGEHNDRPLVVLLHGLTGCETSMNMVRAAACHLARGYSVLRLNLRGAGPSRTICRGDYHAGCSRDLADALASLREQEPALVARGLLLSGVSLGANVMIKFLAEFGSDFPIRAAASVSAPIDLALSCRSLMRRRNAPYHRWLLHRMKLDCQGSEMDAAARAALAAARSVYEFDDTYVAPRHGFSGAPEYYENSMALRYLDGVRVPILLIHAHDDPWVPVAPYLAHDWSRNPALHVLLARRGGHVGFHGRGHDASWHDRCAAQFFSGFC
jgi:predicted alpha/beta-fold hydrolase